MIENVFHSQESERQGNHENRVGGITALNDMNSAPQVDPPGVEKLPKQRPEVFTQVPVEIISFFGHGVPLDVNSFDTILPLFVALASWTQYGHFVSVVLE